MKEIIKKIPNWLRYILAIPLSIVGAYALEFLFLFFAAMSGDYNTDLFILIERYIIVNVATYFFFFYFLNIILPAYQFQFTCGISVLLGALYCMAFGMYITLGINFDVISFILGMLTFIINPYLSYNKYFDKD